MALKCLRLARSVSDPAAAEVLRDMAAEYEALAERPCRCRHLHGRND